MLTEDMLNYVRENLQAGYTKDDIKAALMASGWSEGDIDASFTALGDIKPLPPPKPEQTHMTMKRKDGSVEVIDGDELGIPHIGEDTAHLSELQQQTNFEVRRIEALAKFEEEKQARKETYLSDEVGLYGFMIRNNLANNRQAAQVLLVVGGFTLLVIVYWIFLR